MLPARESRQQTSPANWEVSNGQVEIVSRSLRSSDLKWHIKVKPTSASTTEVTLPVTTDCEDDGAVCRGDERQVSVAVTGSR